MKQNKIIAIINIILILAMIIHVSIRMYLHWQHVEYSSPFYVELIYAIYYLIPLVVINIVNYFLNKNT